MNRIEIASRVTNAASLTGEFKLRSGGTSNRYFDKYMFESEPDLLKAICDELAPMIPDETEVLVGMEMGGIPIATLLSQLSGLPLALARKQAKTYGTLKQIEGAVTDGRNALIVEDVITSGGAVADVVDVMRAQGALIQTTLCVINRNIVNPAAFIERDIELLQLFTLEDFGD
jgi:orotate phosphoribosyltransferase